eukprot:6095969-Amphidinium_carterae.1
MEVRNKPGKVEKLHCRGATDGLAHKIPGLFPEMTDVICRSQHDCRLGCITTRARRANAYPYQYIKVR